MNRAKLLAFCVAFAIAAPAFADEPVKLKYASPAPPQSLVTLLEKSVHDLVGFQDLHEQQGLLFLQDRVGAGNDVRMRFLGFPAVGGACAAWLDREEEGLAHCDISPEQRLTGFDDSSFS